MKGPKNKEKILTGVIPWRKSDFLDVCRYAKNHKWDGEPHEVALDYILDQYPDIDGAAHAIRFVKIIRFIRNHFEELNKAKLVNRKKNEDAVISDRLLEALCYLDYSALVINENDILEYGFDIKDVYLWIKLSNNSQMV